MGKLLKGCLLALAGLALLVVLAFAAMVGWSLYANDRADREADAFCRGVRPGQDLGAVLERAKGAGGPRNSRKVGDIQRLYWYGMIFHSQECEISTAAGRVLSARRVSHDD